MIKVLSVLIGVFFMFSPQAYAAGSIGVVDVIYILNNSDAAKHIQEQREEYRQKFLKEISEVEQELRLEEKRLSENRADMEQAAYMEARKAYETKLLETRRIAQNKKRLLEDASNKAMNALRDELTAIVQEIANEKGYELVISNQNVITGAKPLDITSETFERLNKQRPSIEMVLEDEEMSGNKDKE